MPFENFTDARGQVHSIYMQERGCTCAIATIATLSKLLRNTELQEKDIRYVSQFLPYSYHPLPRSIGATQKTFLTSIAQEPLHSANGIILTPHFPGSSQEAINALLKHFNFYSNEKALDELLLISEDNYKDKLKNKIIFLGIAVNQKDSHAILIRDVWDDGTIIIYDSWLGLVQTKDILKFYGLRNYRDLFLDADADCYFATYQKEFDLEAQKDSTTNGVVATHVITYFGLFKNNFYSSEKLESGSLYEGNNQSHSLFRKAINQASKYF